MSNFILLSFLFYCCCLAGASYPTCDSGKGICVNTTTETCDGGTLKIGYCVGPAEIICCEYSSCDSGNGMCIDISKQECGGTLKTGYCPGSSNIQCCESNNLPKECYNGGPPLLDNSYEFTLKSQGILEIRSALLF